ncbi:MAG: hypothetical protein COX44_00675 [Candidatus Portnoybacteria bacterium CG23_combo_of_CG06-09_8_20_14_all_37_13]|uniref:SpoVT-AbrB domain-containing protein n=1 Tax=Candidatus Portnoybacteria bacterium CG23_combo_of_CG06-09_8_20_14_all_37_13 TaxID=1974819 RepID=A0A2G9YDH8_9BACT|nr:MAG: hypothetical protein COX44_00675 [Candidatus Portnoybacteria bacterium CG23_combo_of_CG06-09_8_20_14_all_37_13]
MPQLQSIIKVNQNFQVTIPAIIRKKYNIDGGDLIEASATEQGILLKPKLLLDKLPEVELSEKGKKMLRESLNDIRKGCLSGPYNNTDDLLANLKK